MRQPGGDADGVGQQSGCAPRRKVQSTQGINLTARLFGKTIRLMTNVVPPHVLPGLLLADLPPEASAQKAAYDSSRWEKEIAAYEAQDKEKPPAKGQIVFIGSSTIRRWT